MPWFFETKKEKAEREARKIERQKEKAAIRDCKYFSELIPDVLARQGVDHWLPRPDRPTLGESIITGAKSRQKVKIVETRWNEHAIYLMIDPRELPYRASLKDLYTDEILETLSSACQRQVAWRSDPGKGSWYIVWRNGAINAIPVHFAYHDAAAMLPRNAGPLAFIAGVAENNTLMQADIAAMPHYLVAGSTGQGKSVHLNQMICQLITRNTPATLQMIMIDMKRGAEFALYENLPHLIMPIITRPEGVEAALDVFWQEMERRSELFADVGVKTIHGYNDKYPDAKLPFWLLLFDEIALILMGKDKKLKERVEKVLYEILAGSRSSGGHCVLCTQTPRSDVISAYIKVNCSTRICFAVPGNHDSMAVLDRGDAAGLEPKGRGMYLNGASLTEIQSPYISDDHIKMIVRESIARAGGVVPKDTSVVTLDDLLRMAIDDYSGKLWSKLLFPRFSGKIARAALENMLAESEGKTFDIDGTLYHVINKGKGKHGGRQIKPVVEMPTDSESFGDKPDRPALTLSITPQSPHSFLKPKTIPGQRKVS